MDSMCTDAFYGVILSDLERLAQFEVDTEGLADHKLTLKQISLGETATNGEYNVVQAETFINGKGDTKIPIAVLKAGETRVLRPNIEFPNASVTFKLIQGNGPVYIVGQHRTRDVDEEDWFNNEDEEADYDDDDVVPPPPQTNGKNGNKKK